MKLILSRHGNTFSQTDTVYWVGSRNDLPLTDAGCRQAEDLGEALKDAPALSAIYFAPLKRTREFAEIAARVAGSNSPLIADERLTELDYGEWSGLTDEQVKAKFGEDCFSAWTLNCIWPPDCGWSGTPELIEKEIRDFAEHLRITYPEEATVLAVTSNGRLRYFLKLVEEEFERRIESGSLKVGTGKICVLNLQERKSGLELWNEPPQSLLSGSVRR